MEILRASTLALKFHLPLSPFFGLWSHANNTHTWTTTELPSVSIVHPHQSSRPLLTPPYTRRKISVRFCPLYKLDSRIFWNPGLFDFFGPEHLGGSGKFRRSKGAQFTVKPSTVRQAGGCLWESPPPSASKEILHCSKASPASTSLSPVCRPPPPRLETLFPPSGFLGRLPMSCKPRNHSVSCYFGIFLSRLLCPCNSIFPPLPLSFSRHPSWCVPAFLVVIEEGSSFVISHLFGRFWILIFLMSLPCKSSLIFQPYLLF